MSVWCIKQTRAQREVFPSSSRKCTRLWRQFVVESTWFTIRIRWLKYFIYSHVSRALNRKSLLFRSKKWILWIWTWLRHCAQTQYSCLRSLSHAQVGPTDVKLILMCSSLCLRSESKYSFNAPSFPPSSSLLFALSPCEAAALFLKCSRFASWIIFKVTVKANTHTHTHTHSAFVTRRL